eukprot:TRINITY_DN17194_c0_g1_i1.p1 TRINITY_DN17194_c0_g1~~TRINITY_DN17194_c0_g1_i1.p1  ORF type:complete len:453 (+),score=111.71 TRINITY_DN17194_c0_g1_i1:160-1518(+)
MNSALSLCLLLVVGLVVVSVTARPVIQHIHKHHSPVPHPKMNSADRWGAINMRSIEPANALTPDFNGYGVVGIGGSIWPTSIYWALITIGTPGTAFPVAIDSGSYTLDVPLEGCKNCAQTPPNQAYNPTNTSTGSVVKCGQGCPPQSGCETFGGVKDVCVFSNTYETCVPTNPTQPCTIAGPWYTDSVMYGGVGPAEVVFGTIDTQTTNFYQFAAIDGVCGMGGPAGSTNVFSSIVKAGGVTDNVWGICFNEGEVSNGTLVLGGVYQELATAPLIYTKNVGGEQFYAMGISGITIGGASIKGVQSSIIIDTGTNDLLIPTAAYNSMKAELLDQCSTGNFTGMCNVPSDKTLFDGQCFAMTPEMAAEFPDIVLQVDNVPLTLTGADYVLQGFGSEPFQPNGNYCLGISPTGSAGALQILGDTLMQNYYAVFDVVNHQIGWAPVNRSACGTLEI